MRVHHADRSKGMLPQSTSGCGVPCLDFPVAPAANPGEGEVRSVRGEFDADRDHAGFDALEELPRRHVAKLDGPAAPRRGNGLAVEGEVELREVRPARAINGVQPGERID